MEFRLDGRQIPTNTPTEPKEFIARLSGRVSLTSCLCLVLFLRISFFATTSHAQEDSPTETPLSTADYLLELDKLAAKCDDLELPEQAKQTRAWWPRERSDQTWLVFPTTVAAVDGSGSAELIAKWKTRFELLRRRHALHLLKLVDAQLEAKQEPTAYRLLWRAYREDPQNKQLQFVLQSFLAATDFESKLRLSTTAHPKFGWPAKTFHRVQLPHFRVVSNAAKDVIASWTEQLEKIFVVWTQAYPDLWLSPGALKHRLAGRNVPLERKAEMNVVLFASREGYVNQLGKSELRIENSVGYYAPKDTTSYFYVENNQVPFATLVHELTHQILQESSLLRGSEPWETQSDFWVVEAIALHAESMWIGKEWATIGGWESPRLQVGRYRMLRDDYWIDWEELRSHSAENWKQQPEIAKAYTQSAGLAHLWLDDPDPAKREAFFSYLTSVYRGKPSLEKMNALIVTKDWREQYRRMLQVDRELLMRLDPEREMEECVLIGCDLPESGLDFLATQKNLKWLDVSFLPIGDDATSAIGSLSSLERLSLEGTEIANATLQHIRTLENLNELDLSATKTDDVGFQQLAELSKLETLWLSGTAVTDKSLPLIERMSSLRFVQIDESQISSEGWKQLLMKRPELAPNPTDQ
jgi:hypothetical protein